LDDLPVPPATGRRPRPRRHRDTGPWPGVVRRLRAGTELVEAWPSRGGHGVITSVLIGALAGFIVGRVVGLPWVATTAAGVVLGVVVRIYLVGGLFRAPVSAGFVRRLQSITGDQVVLRPLRGADAPALAADLDQVVIAEMGWTDAHVAGYGEFMRHPYLLSQLGHLAICERETSKVIGEVSLANVDERYGNAEMGVWLGPDGRGRGLGTEIFRLAFATYHQAGLTLILCVTSTANQAIQHILPRVGATFLDQRPHELPDGRLIDSLWYEHRAP
jgi:RimJ/RimL family protein N-acetyltransferase